MITIDKFIHQLKQFPFIQKNEMQLVAVSGGVDSVVLCDLLFKAGYNFKLAHCNFQLRGLESERDEQFVANLSKQYGKPLFVKKFDTKNYAQLHKVSIQVAARELRYSWFTEIVSRSFDAGADNQHISILQTTNHQEKDNGPQQWENDLQSMENEKQERVTNKWGYILTAHHADDNIETVIMNFFRGTGIKGLAGMQNVSGKIFRPLLNCRKNEIIEYAINHQLPFVEDSSNSDSHYTRNFFRNDLLPSIRNFFSQADENILQTINHVNEANEIYSEAIKNYKLKLLEERGNEQYIAILKLQKQVAYKTILWEILKEKTFNAAQTDEVIRLMDADNGSYIDAITHRILKNRKWLIIAPIKPQELLSHIVIEKRDKKISFSGGELQLKPNIPIEAFSLSPESRIALLDADMMTFPLLLRKWKQGDYFYPLGMTKKKKISRFLIDRKLSVFAKENIWVVESNKKIVWVVNHRIDNRFKVTDKTKHIFRIEWNDTV